MKSGRIFLLLFLVALGQAFADIDTVRRGAAITLKVPSFAQAQASLLELVTKHQGIAADRHQTSSEGGRINGWTRVVLPKAQLDSFLFEVQQLGKAYGEKLSLKNDSSIYEDLGNRAQRLRQHEGRLSNILVQRKGLRGSDILFVQERLYRASTDEDTLTEKRNSIPAQATKSSVVVTLFEPSIVKDQPRGVAGRVKAAFDDAFRGLAFEMLNWVGTGLNLILYAIIAGILWLVFRRPIRAGLARIKGSLALDGLHIKLGGRGEKPTETPLP